MTIHEEDSDFLKHFGVPGMKWGKRKSAKIQKKADRLDRVSKGTNSALDRVKVFAQSGVLSRKGADRLLKTSTRIQDKIVNGDMVIGETLLKVGGVRLSEIDYHR